MRLSKTFTRTLRDAPKDEQAKSAQYLIRAGYIYKELAGIYDFLPLGFLTLEKIKNIIREEMNKIDGQEVFMASLQSPKLWEKTDRWDDEKMDIWFKTELASGGELGLAPTHEEPITNMLKDYVLSYKDLPFMVYQFQNKFRNELRAKSGILRTREFIMKDMYSFCADENTHEELYKKAEEAYYRIYERVGLGECTFKAFASGGAFSKFSHEFQTIIPVGEDTIYFNEDKSIVLNEEVVIPEVLEGLGVGKSELKTEKACEVGNIFTLKTKYSEPLDLEFADQDGKKKPVIMGCYGIGVSRLMGVIAEKFADEKGLVWPEEVAPFKYYLIPIGEEGLRKAEEIYRGSEDKMILDDRDLRPGEKFADAELLGIPYRVVVSDKTLEDGKVEIVERKTGEKKLLTLAEFADKL